MKKCLLDDGYKDLIPPNECWYGDENKISDCKKCKYYNVSFDYDELTYDERKMLAYCVEHMYDCDLSEWSIEDKKTMLRLCKMFDINRQSLGWNSDEVENED